jgi:hypothetical protein
VVGYEGYYEVSDLGRVRSLDRVATRSGGSHPRPIRGQVLAIQTRDNGSGYTTQAISLSREGQRRARSVHALVIASFVGPRPAGAEVCHNNGDGTDNRLLNLRYDSRSGNVLDTVRHGTHRQAARTHCPRGHLLIEPNLRPHDLTLGFRNCRSCDMARLAIRRARRAGRPYDMQRLSDDRYAKLMRSSA